MMRPMDFNEKFEVPEDLDIDTWVPPLSSPLPIRVDASEEVWDKLLDYLLDDEDEKEITDHE